MLVSSPNCSTLDSIDIKFYPVPMVYLGKDTSVCEGDTFLLIATYPNSTYLWHDNSIDSILETINSGIHWVKVTLGNCSTIDSIIISHKPLPLVSLGNDTTICEGDELILDATFPNASYLWNNNTTIPTCLASKEGTYWVELALNNCFNNDTINIFLADCGKPCNSVFLYPNPTSDMITLEFDCIIPDATVFELFDIIGKLIGIYHLPNNTKLLSINLFYLSNGVYGYRIRNNETLLKKDRLIIID
ncbi:T9SS type A sorting domain-containing protein [Bacteroidota bacterium]